MTNKTMRKGYTSWLTSISIAASYTYMGSEIVDYGDKFIQNGMKEQVKTYNITDYMNDAYYAYGYTGYFIYGPGITEDADKSWLLNYPLLHSYVRYSVFSSRCILFKKIEEVTIENILSENYTK
jgi:hypothetical protein